MTSSALFLIQAFVIVALPVVLLRVSGLKGSLPLVVVQIAVGVALGPSLFGRLAPEAFAVFAGPGALAPLNGLATVAVLIFALISGLHVEFDVFSGRERAFWPVAAASILAPMAFGALAALLILARYPDELRPGVTQAEFLVAIGVCVSMNALPVLSAILAEMGLLGGRVARIALGVAGVNNMVLWIVLGLLLTVSAAGHGGGRHGFAPPLALIALAPVYLFLMLKVARPLLARMLTVRMSDDLVNPRALVVLGAATIASALATELLGLHAIIGAFLVGAIIPPALHKPIIDRIQVMTVALLLPFFFTLTGLRIYIDVDAGPLLEMLAVIAAVAIGGVTLSTAVAARLAGEDWPAAFGLGALLQSKGLTELIVLTMLLDAGVVSPRIFAAMIVMALLSATVAMPLARASFGARAPAPLRAGEQEA